jgi:thiamine transport system ATP-binding protein
MLEVSNVTVRFNGVTALDDVSLSVPVGSITALLGPSGSGKSTLLRVVAGLERARTVVWNGRVMDDVPVHRRGFGLMFQDHALFPHLDVEANVGFGLRMSHHPDPASRITEVLEMVGLAGYEHRSTATLSGGEAQRVALARALAPAPELLMLDEPFGSLDRPLRERLVDECSVLFRQIGITVIHVTHDHDEALAIADEVAILDDGHLVQHGPPVEVWRHPANATVARFLGYDAIGPARIALGTADTPWGVVTGVDLPDGDHEVVVLPGAVHIDPSGPIEATVDRIRVGAGRHELVVRVDHQRLKCFLEGPPVPPGTPLRVRIDPTGIVALGG